MAAEPAWLAPLPDKAAVLVSSVDHTLLCSGVAVEPAAVMTAKHCTEGTSPLRVYVQGGAVHPVQNVLISKGLDVALLILAPAVSLPVARVSSSTPPFGAILFVAGFGCYDPVLDIRPVVYTGMDESGDMVLSGTFCRGDSGGGLFDAEGNLVGLATARAASGKPIGWGVAIPPRWVR